MNFKGPYHAILRRPYYAKIIAILSYAYLKLKMLGPAVSSPSWVVSKMHMSARGWLLNRSNRT
jgi:hypothetical protein